MERKNYLALLLFAATALTIWAFGLILSPFLVPIAWAMCLVTVTGGLYHRLAKRTGWPRLSAFAMTVAVGAAVLVPVVFVGVTLAQEANAFAAKATARTEPRPGSPATPATGDSWDRFFAEHEKLGSAKDRVDGLLKPFDTDVRQVVEAARERISAPLATGAVGVLSNALQAAFGLLMMLATLYFLYRDGDKIRALVVDLVPVTEEASDRVLEVLRSTAFAAIVGGLVTALIQGTLGGIAFAVTGVSGPVLWGFVMGVLSLLPVGGSAFVWAPVAVYFYVEGPVWKAWYLLVWGLVVIGCSDNLLRPWLMRKTGAAEIHPLLLFFAIISGIGLFGASGVVFGPLLLAFVLVVVKIYRENFGRAARAGAATKAAAAAAKAGPAAGT